MAFDAKIVVFSQGRLEKVGIPDLALVSKGSWSTPKLRNRTARTS